MARIQKCIKDILFITRHSEDLGRAEHMSNFSSKPKRNIGGVLRCREQVRNPGSARKVCMTTWNL